MLFFVSWSILTNMSSYSPSSVSSGALLSSAPMMQKGTPTNIAATAAAAAASAASKKATQLKQALVQYNNERVSWIFAIAMGGLMVLFTLFHWVRFLHGRSTSKGSQGSLVMRYQVATAR
jgi:hypothetical protein